MVRSIYVHPDTNFDMLLSFTALSAAKRFPQIVKEHDLMALDSEISCYDANRGILPSTTDVEKYWNEVGSMQDDVGELRFPILTKLAKGLLSLPHGNADVERIFSHVTLIRTDKRNMLGHDTVNSILHSKFNEVPCYDFKPELSAIDECRKATKRLLQKGSQKQATSSSDTEIQVVEADDALSLKSVPSTSTAPVPSPKKRNPCQRTLTDMFASTCSKRQRRTPNNTSDFYTGDFYVSDEGEVDESD
jgi:hypothetical protein